MILDDRAAAVGALLGQRRVDGFIDTLGRRRLPMGVVTVLPALLAAWLFGMSFRFAFGEWSSLTLGRAFEFLDAPLQLGDEFAKLLVFADQLFVGRRVHADLDSDKTMSAVRDYRDFHDSGQDGAKQSRINSMQPKFASQRSVGQSWQRWKSLTLR